MLVDKIIKKIMVLVRPYCTDQVFIYTNLPSPFPPGVDDGGLVLHFEAQKGKGIEYVRYHFNREPDTIDVGELGK